MKKIFTICITALLLVAGGFAIVTNHKNTAAFLDENVDALAADEGGVTVVDVICKVLGCCGGDKKCFSGSYKGFSGTFYME